MILEELHTLINKIEEKLEIHPVRSDQVYLNAIKVLEQCLHTNFKSLVIIYTRYAQGVLEHSTA